MFYKSLTIALASFFLISCGDNQPSDQHNTLRVATSPDYPPFEYYKDGEVVGFEIDLVKEIGRVLGKKVTFHPMDFNTIIPAIQSGRADVGVSTFSITPERSKSVQFSEPYHSSQIFLLFLKKSSVQGFTDLMNEKVGAQLGSTMEYCAKEKKKTIPMDIVLLNTNPQLVEELKSGRIKAILVEEDQVDAFKKENPDLDAVAVEEKGDPKAIVLSKESDLHAAVNKAIAQLKSSGKIDELQKKWLKTSRTRG